MEYIFLNLVNMSFVASWLVLAVFVLRLPLKKAPRRLHCILWGLVGVRLVFPFSIESVFSLIPSTKPLPAEIITSQNPQIDSGVPIIDNAINPILTASFLEKPGYSTNPTQIWLVILAYAWLIGMILMLTYALVSYLLIRRRVRTATLLRDNIKQSEMVDFAFVLGVFRPKIYIPYRMDTVDMEYVIAHEKAHISRLDHLWKPLGFLLLSIYWFNPILWIAYVLLCRDIEVACDEKVVHSMEKAALQAYSTALLNCSVHRRRIATCPLAFGEVGVKTRVKSVMNYKKPAFWVIVVAVLASFAVAIGFMTNPIRQDDRDNILSDGKIPVLQCQVSGENHEEYITARYFSNDSQRKKDNLPQGTIYNNERLTFTTSWETETLWISEEYYENSGTSATFIDMNTYELKRNEQGTFTLDVTHRDGKADETVIYYIDAPDGVFIMKVNFMSIPAAVNNYFDENSSPDLHENTVVAVQRDISEFVDNFEIVNADYYVYMNKGLVDMELKLLDDFLQFYRVTILLDDGTVGPDNANDTRAESEWLNEFLTSPKGKIIDIDVLEINSDS